MRLSALLILLLIGACASVPTPTPPEPEPAPTVDQRAGARAKLVSERAWLQTWFEGTPVRIAQPSDRELLVEVPLEFCFAAGKSRVEPPLAAVLDKVAESLRRMPLARLELVAAPGDGERGRKLAEQRALQVKKDLLARGVPPARIGEAGAAPAPQVQLRIVIVPG